jgi:chromate reductase
MSKVAIIVGSLRKGSYSRKIAQHLIDHAPKGQTAKIVEIGSLPFYNEDLETDHPPAEWVAFRKEIKDADAVIFVTPEYNRSTSAVIKNAIDVGSRPYGKSVWTHKPAAVVSSSPGSIGGFGANHHLRQSLVFLDMPTLQQPEMYISSIHKAFDENGKVADENVRKLLTSFAIKFEQWIAHTKHHLALAS